MYAVRQNDYSIRPIILFVESFFEIKALKRYSYVSYPNRLLTEFTTILKMFLGGFSDMNDISKAIGKRIKELRNERGISQQNLADQLGLNRSTISQIEGGERKITAEELLKLSEFLDVSCESLLGAKKEPEVILAKEKTATGKQELRISVPQKKVAKLKEVLLYILNRVGSKPNIGETVIYKLLYFIDFDFYEKYEEQLIGATYIKNKYGPTPREFKKIVDKMIEDEEIERVESKYHKYPQIKYLPRREPDLSMLTANELILIDEVLNRLSNMNATQISDYSHSDVPWLATENNKAIEYEYVFYRASPYTVREYEDDEVQ
jgi:transcriptional regulator with XRE-family HTH domain